MNNNNKDKVGCRMNTLRTQIDDAVNQISNMNRQLSTLDNQRNDISHQKREHENILDAARSENEKDMKALEDLNYISFLKARNYTLYLTAQDLLVIPFTNNQYVMPFEITSIAILNEMTIAELKYYLRGYNLPDEGNKTVLRYRLIGFLGIAEGAAQFLYNPEQATRDPRR
jgi:chromosome segregation ATPase